MDQKARGLGGLVGLLQRLRRWSRPDMQGSQPVDSLTALFGPAQGSAASSVTVSPETITADAPAPRLDLTGNMLPDPASMAGQGWAERGMVEAFPSDLPPLYPGTAVMCHRLRSATDFTNALAYGVTLPGTLTPGDLYVVSADVWIPSSFVGTEISMVAAGLASRTICRADLDQRETWQRIWTSAKLPDDSSSIFPGLFIVGAVGSTVHSTGWRLDAGEVAHPFLGKCDFAEQEILGYPYNQGGLNNQKLAFLGLLLAARNSPARKIRLPALQTEAMVLSRTDKLTPFSAIFALERLKEFTQRHGIVITEGPPLERGGDRERAFGWDYFNDGLFHLCSTSWMEGAGIDDFACELFRHMQPLNRGPVLARLSQTVFEEVGIQVVAQLRIEQDWVNFAPIFNESGVPPEDFLPSFGEIIAKIKYSLDEASRGVFVVCDEARLPTPKEVIRETVAREYGINLFWKSDFLPPAQMAAMTPLRQSVLDFEIAVAAPVFVGITRSSFSNMVSFERFARSRQPVTRHYAYNLPGPALGRRFDNGVYTDPRHATRPVERAPHSDRLAI